LSTDTEPVAGLNARSIVIVGGSGTGKSTLARALQEQLLPIQWLHFSVDTILYCLPTSILDRANLQNDWSLIDAHSIRQSAYACLRALLDDERRVIFDCVVMSERGARELLLALETYRPILIELTCSWEETLRRTRARGDRTHEEAEHGFKTAGLHLNADHTFDTTIRNHHELASAVIHACRGQGVHRAWDANLARLRGAS